MSYADQGTLADPAPAGAVRPEAGLQIRGFQSQEAVNLVRQVDSREPEVFRLVRKADG